MIVPIDEEFLALMKRDTKGLVVFYNRNLVEDNRVAKYGDLVFTIDAQKQINP